MSNDLLSLYLLAAHTGGDFLLQTNHMATHKFGSTFVRAKHVSAYSLPFVGAAALSSWSTRQRVAFLAGNWVTHFAIDTKRWKEPAEGFETLPVWFDQALHVTSLGLLAALVEAIGDYNNG